jgi:hypothetical protein
MALITFAVLLDVFCLDVLRWTLFAPRSRTRTGHKIVAVDVAAAVYMNNSYTHSAEAEALACKGLLYS